MQNSNKNRRTASYNFNFNRTTMILFHYMKYHYKIRDPKAVRRRTLESTYGMLLQASPPQIRELAKTRHMNTRALS